MYNKLKHYSFIEDVKNNYEIISYFLGYFVTDGHLTKKNTIEITSKDKQILEDMKSFTNSSKLHKRLLNNKIYYKICYGKELGNYIYNLGFVSKKTGKEFIPLNIKKKNFKHFLRGVIDGDGCLDSQDNGKHLRCRICSGSKDFLDSLVYKLKEYYIINKDFKAITHKTKRYECYTITFRHYDSISICKYVYKNANIFLKRKYDIFKITENFS